MIFKIKKRKKIRRINARFAVTATCSWTLLDKNKHCVCFILTVNMHDIVINEVEISFPYPNPYAVQRVYMEKVVECLKDSKNGVLESPTGL